MSVAPCVQQCCGPVAGERCVKALGFHVVEAWFFVHSMQVTTTLPRRSSTMERLCSFIVLIPALDMEMKPWGCVVHVVPHQCSQSLTQCSHSLTQCPHSLTTGHIPSPIGHISSFSVLRCIEARQECLIIVVYVSVCQKYSAPFVNSLSSNIGLF